MKLYEINQALEKVLNDGFCVDEDTGEILFTEEDLENLKIEKSEKIENIALFIKNKVALSEEIAEEIAKMQSRKKSIEKKIEYLKQYLMDCLDGEKFETSKVEIKYRKSKKVICENVDILPDNLKRVKIDVSADLKTIGERIKSGEVIAGCRIEEKNNIQIK